MLLKLFKSNHPYVIFLIPLLALVLWIPTLFNLSDNLNTSHLDNTTFVFNWLLGVISFNLKFSVVFALILVIVESYMLLRLNFKYIFIDNKTYLPSVLFVIFASTLSSYQNFYPLLVGNLFILLALDRAFLIDKSKNQFKRYFESGFFLGLGALFYPNIYPIIVIIWLTLFVLRTFNWREWFSSTLGLFAPFTLYLAALFLTDNLEGVYEKLAAVLFQQASPLSFSIYSQIALGFIGLIVLIAIILHIRPVVGKKINTRKYHTLFFWFAVYVLALFFFNPSMGYELAITLAIPISIICSIFLTDIKTKWISEVIFGLTLLGVIVIIWFH